MRSLDDKFLDDLKSGVLRPLLDAVISDTTLCLELRGDSINIYYRGGSLMKITQNDHGYTSSFTESYFKCGKKVCLLPAHIQKLEDVDKWLEVSPELKHAIDRYFGKHSNDECEFQQLLVRDNNFGSIANDTDYYICDIEYASSNARFDMIAVHWPSTTAARKNQDNHRLVLIEKKHGDGALGGNSGIHKHIEDINNYLSDSKNVQDLKEDMRDVFNQKRNLGLIKCERDLNCFSNEKPILLLVLANHDPEKSALGKLLEELPESPHIDLRIATASFLGYGLYDQGIHTIEKAKELFSEYIYCRNNPKAS